MTDAAFSLQCKDCTRWYGAEDDEIGPCMIKHARGEARHLTHGSHECDEPENIAQYQARAAGHTEPPAS